MGYFCLPLGKTWQENLDEAVANIELLKQSPDCEYLFTLIVQCVDNAERKHRVEYPELYGPLDQDDR